VIDYIDRHLDENLDLATLAGVAHFSAFHFHRLFHALTERTDRRLHPAPTRGAGGDAVAFTADVPVLEIALAVGFGSTEAFARAFRARFGCTPTRWRNSKHDQLARKAGQAPRFGDPKNGGKSKQETAMKVRLIDREPTHVAYLRYSGPVGAAIGTFWMATVAPWMGTNNLYGRDRYGISLDDPSVTKDGNIRYDACVASPEGEVLTGNPQRKVIPGGKYAAMSFKGTWRGDRRGVGCTAARLAAEERHAARLKTVLRALPADRRIRRETGRSAAICVCRWRRCR
jgi:AraC family transcriptional regulator